MSKSETIRCLLIGDLRRIFRHRYGATLPDDDAGREDLDLLLRLHAVSPNAAEKKMQFEVEVLAPWMPKSEADDLLDSYLRYDPRRVRPSRKSFATVSTSQTPSESVSRFGGSIRLT